MKAHIRLSSEPRSNDKRLCVLTCCGFYHLTSHHHFPAGILTPSFLSSLCSRRPHLSIPWPHRHSCCSQMIIRCLRMLAKFASPSSSTRKNTKWIYTDNLQIRLTEFNSQENEVNIYTDTIECREDPATYQNSHSRLCFAGNREHLRTLIVQRKVTWTDYGRISQHAQF